jgi:hypothetical protein
MTRDVELTFGALAENIHGQLAKQNLALPMTAQPFQKLADAVTLLTIQGVLTGAECHRARVRLLRKVAKIAKPL